VKTVPRQCKHIGAANDSGRTGSTEELAQAVLFAFTNTLMTDVIQDRRRRATAETNRTAEVFKYMSGEEDFEEAITRRVWTDPAFADQCEVDPLDALASIGVHIRPGVKVEIKVQRRDTIYFLLPPARDASAPESGEVMNQFDLWRSANSFVWIFPEDTFYDILGMRRNFHPASPLLTGEADG
jgi:hypothetical protein